MLDISAQGFTLIDYLNVRTIVEWKDKSTSGHPITFNTITNLFLSRGRHCDSGVCIYAIPWPLGQMNTWIVLRSENSY